MINPELKQEIVNQGAKAAPAVAGTIYSAITLNHLVAFATLVYVLMQIYVLLRRHIWEVQERKNKPDQ